MILNHCCVTELQVNKEQSSLIIDTVNKIQVNYSYQSDVISYKRSVNPRHFRVNIISTQLGGYFQCQEEQGELA